MRLIAVLAGALAGIAMLAALFWGSSTEFEDAALNEATTSLFESVGGTRVHCQDARDARLCLDGLAAAHARRVVLWLGNSQLHAVNQYQRGQHNATPLLHTTLREKGFYEVTFSEPNANLQEHLAVFAAVLARTKIDTLLLPVVFDDTREDGVRPGVLQMLDSERAAGLLAGSEIGRKILQAKQASASDTDADSAGLNATFQKRVERAITDWLSAHSELWRLRPEARGQIQLGLYRLRNRVFGIRPDSKRRVIPARLHDNTAALDAILALAAREGVRVLVYVAPIRDDVPSPYVEADYARFKQDVARRSAAAGARFVNLESLVPGRLWGAKESTSGGEGVEIDYMHFQADGHRLLAARLAAEILAP